MIKSAVFPPPIRMPWIGHCDVPKLLFPFLHGAAVALRQPR
jgi:hypothetical protein